MDHYIKITKEFLKTFGSKVINRQYFLRKTGLKRKPTRTLEPSAAAE